MRNSYGNNLSTVARPSETGSISLPLILLSVVLSGAAVSTLTLAMLWRGKVNLQLRLDRCVESVALELTSIQNLIEASNLRMKIERAAAQAAALPTFGGSLEAVQPVLAAEVFLQEGARVRWRMRQMRWIAERGCDRKADLFLPLPELKWVRPPVDSVGPQPLDWQGGRTRLDFRLWRENRKSQARVNRGRSKNERNDDGSSLERVTGNWEASWVRIGPSLD